MGERMTPAELVAAEALANAASREPWSGRPWPRQAVELVPRLVAEVRARDTELAATRASEARLVVELAQRDTVIEAVRDAILLAVDGPSMTIDGKRAIQGVLDVLATPETERVKLFNPDGTARTNAEIRAEAARILEAQLVSRALEGGVK